MDTARAELAPLISSTGEHIIFVIEIPYKVITNKVIGFISAAPVQLFGSLISRLQSVQDVSLFQSIDND